MKFPEHAEQSESKSGKLHDLDFPPAAQQPRLRGRRGFSAHRRATKFQIGQFVRFAAPAPIIGRMDFTAR